jgi:hypothetical protein
MPRAKGIFYLVMFGTSRTLSPKEISPEIAHEI